jgi:hypothetical protein
MSTRFLEIVFLALNLHKLFFFQNMLLEEEKVIYDFVYIL